MNSEFLARLADPPKRYRPIPFWSWNERLQEEETRRQIAEMDKVGIGGYFMHARGGLETPYMGDEWMANIAAGVEEARERGMGAWAYDENGWPSGFGDGRVNGRGLEFQQKYLRMEEVAEPVTREDGRTITNLTLENGRVLHFHFDVNPFYVDTLDAEVIATFLREIYDPYAEEFGADFGKAMPGFFTDEPQISRNGIPWSFTLPEAYRVRYGEDLLAVLPDLFLARPDHQRTRYRFWYLVQELFVTNFTQQIYDWCEAHGAKLTGHMVLEETLLSQITSNAAVMPHYEFFHVPGMDWLCRYINPPTTPLQVASVCHQVGHAQILSETFALTGWNVPFEQLKWMYEWQMVRGINLLCQHLEGYSLRGIRKRDYPPSLFYQQPWWEQYRYFNDAMSRVGMLLADGIPRFEVLVLHPQSSAWLCFDNAANNGIDDLNTAFIQLTHKLEAAQIPFHFGDERILARHGRVQDNRLVVGTQAYSVVLVPPLDTLAQSTVDLLRAFSETTGTLVWHERRPRLIAGEPAPELDTLTTRGTTVASLDEIVASVPDTVRQVRVARADGTGLESVAVTVRDLSPEQTGGAACRFVFLANADDQVDSPATVTVRGASVARFEPETGAVRPVPFTTTNDGWVQIGHTFPRRGSLALFVSDDAGAFAPAPPVKARTPLSRSLLKGDWELELRDPNSLTLDTCDFWFDGELQAEHEHVSVVQTRAIALERPVDVRMRFQVNVAEPPEGELFLVMEKPADYTVLVNGDAVDTATDSGYYRDTSFRKLDIAGRLVQGANTIELHTRFEQSAKVLENLRRAAVFEAEKNKLTYDCEIEAVYLVGWFGVQTPGTFTDLPREAMRYQGEFVVSSLPTQVNPKDLTREGLPFFNGTVVLRKTLDLGSCQAKGRSLVVTDKTANIVSVRVNGQDAATWYWRPFHADLDGMLTDGENTVELELTGGLRNLLGPHHMEEGESYTVAPACFFKEPNIWGHTRWNDGYCFVRFGIEW